LICKETGEKAAKVGPPETKEKKELTALLRVTHLWKRMLCRLFSGMKKKERGGRKRAKGAAELLLTKGLKALLRELGAIVPR